MSSVRNARFDAQVLEIHKVLDRLDYYRLLGVQQATAAGDVRKSFLAIAAKFHPDRNRNASPQVQRALYDIFKRLNEAYRVLCDPHRREQYNELLTNGQVRFDKGLRQKSGPANPEDAIKNREARNFYREAAQELKAGNLMKAELHIRVAASREAGNKVIELLAKQIINAKKAAAEAKKKKQNKKK